MARFANELRDHIIRPTLAYLGVDNPRAETLMLNAALLSNHFRGDDERLGVYCIAPQQHRQIWDEYLAFNPDLASEVRSLASQRWFLENPDRELIANIAYATAVAWMLFSISGMTLPEVDDLEGQARVWQRLFCAKPDDPALFNRVLAWLGNLRDHNTPPTAQIRAV